VCRVECSGGCRRRIGPTVMQSKVSEFHRSCSTVAVMCHCCANHATQSNPTRHHHSTRPLPLLPFAVSPRFVVPPGSGYVFFSVGAITFAARNSPSSPRCVRCRSAFVSASRVSLPLLQPPLLLSRRNSPATSSPAPTKPLPPHALSAPYAHLFPQVMQPSSPWRSCNTGATPTRTPQRCLQ
jgi:hypothetical protein